MSALDDLFFSTGELVSRDLDAMLTDYHRERPRNLQKELGPSEVGHACRRRLAYGLMQEPECNPDGDPLPSFVGTEAHSGYDKAAKHANKKLGRIRWLAENRVQVTEALGGSCDLYDLDTDTVIDHKFLSATRLKKYMKNAPDTIPRHYRVQIHLYGRGFRNKGFPVKNVMLHLLPRGGMLSGKETFVEEYDDAIVEETIARIVETLALCFDLNIDDHPEMYRVFPATGDEDCKYCPWHRPNPRTVLECDGKKDIGTVVPSRESRGMTA